MLGIRICTHPAISQESNWVQTLQKIVDDTINRAPPCVTYTCQKDHIHMLLLKILAVVNVLAEYGPTKVVKLNTIDNNKEENWLFSEPN